MRHPFRALVVSLVGSVLTAPLMAAHADLISDGGFETTQLQANFNGFEQPSGTLNGWVYSNGSLLINVASAAWIESQTGYGGDQVGGIQETSAISQSFSAISSGTYSVSWLDAGRAPAWGFNDGSQTYIASLFDNTTQVLVASTTLNTTTGSNFSAESFFGVLNGGDSYTLSFTGQDTTDETALIDNVSVSQVVSANEVPEPATLALFGTSLAGLGWMRRRKAI